MKKALGIGLLVLSLCGSAVGQENTMADLIKELGDPLKANAASEALIRMRNVAVPFLEEALDNPDERLRQNAIRCLAGIRTEKSGAILIRAATEGPADLREYAAKILTSWPQQAAEDIYLRVLSGQDWWEVKEAILALAVIRSQKALPEIKSILADPPGWRLYHAALTGVARIETGNSIQLSITDAIRSIESTRFSKTVDQEKLASSIAIVNDNIETALPHILDIYLTLMQGLESGIEPHLKSIIRDAGELAYPYLLIALRDNDERVRFRAEGLVNELGWTEDLILKTKEERRPKTLRGHGSSIYILAQVVDSAGNPISTFEYRRIGGTINGAMPRGPDGSLLDLHPISHPLGEFREQLHQVLGGKATLIVGAQGYATKYHPVDFRNADSLSDIKIVLQKAAIVEGTVQNAEGRGVPGALIWIGPVPYSGHHGRPGHIAKSNDDGSFFSDRLPPGPITLGVLHQDHPATSFDLNLSDSETNHPVLVLPTVVRLFGSMTFGEIAVTEGSVRVDTKEGGKSVMPTDGVYEMKGVPPESTHLAFRAYRLESNGRKTTWSLRKTVELDNLDELEIDARFPAGSAGLAGSILFNGKPIASSLGASLYATRDHDSDLLQIETRTNEMGMFTVSGMPEGKWNVTAHFYDSTLGGFSFKQEVTTVAGETANLHIDFPADDE